MASRRFASSPRSEVRPGRRRRCGGHGLHGTLEEKMNCTSGFLGHSGPNVGKSRVEEDQLAESLTSFWIETLQDFDTLFSAAVTAI